MQTPEQLKATAQTLIELAEKLEKEKEAAGPFKPVNGDRYHTVMHDGHSWYVCSYGFFTGYSTCRKQSEAGNCYRTESEAQDVADQRNFYTRLLTAGDVASNARGFYPVVTKHKTVLYVDYYAVKPGRKFSTEAKARAFVDSEGGEAEFVKNFSRGVGVREDEFPTWKRESDIDRYRRSIAVLYINKIISPSERLNAHKRLHAYIDKSKRGAK